MDLLQLEHFLAVVDERTFDRPRTSPASRRRRAVLGALLALLPGNLPKILSVADVRPHWIGKSDRFWYLKIGPEGRQFVLVDAARNTGGPAFDQARLAAALSRVAGRTYRPNALLFDDFEFVEDGQAIRFEAGGRRWTCSLARYECGEHPESARERREQMAATYPWMDAARAGIYGTSAGGYGAAHAFLQFPDFYKVCVSTASTCSSCPTCITATAGPTRGT